MIRLRLAGLLARRKVVFFLAKVNKEDMVVLRELLETGKVTPVVERSYALADIADAFAYMGEGHCQAKLVVAV